MPLTDVIGASTSGPARAIGRPELGTLEVGTPADATVMRLAEGEFEFVDCNGLVRTGSQSLALEGMVLAGNWWEDVTPATT